MGPAKDGNLVLEELYIGRSALRPGSLCRGSIEGGISLELLGSIVGGKFLDGSLAAFLGIFSFLARAKSLAITSLELVLLGRSCLGGCVLYGG